MTHQAPTPAFVQTSTSAEAIRARIAEQCASVWSLSVLRASAEAGLLGPLARGATSSQLADISRAPTHVITAMLDVLLGAGMVCRDGDRYVAAPGLAAMIEALPLLRADLAATFGNSARLMEDARRGTLGGGWQFEDPEIILAQATMSRALGARMHAMMGEMMPGLAARLSAPGARTLDVGSGACGGAISLCERYPSATLVALEPRAASRALAARHIAEAGQETRITQRDQTIQDLDDDSTYDFAFVAQQFMSGDVIDRGLANVRRALKPGGWAVAASMSPPGDDLRSSLLRLRNTLWGGGTRSADDLKQRFVAAGFVDVVTPPMPPGAIYSPVIGRRAE